MSGRFDDFLHHLSDEQRVCEVGDGASSPATEPNAATPFRWGGLAFQGICPGQFTCVSKNADHLFRDLAEIVVPVKARGCSFDPEELLVFDGKQIERCLHVFRAAPKIVAHLNDKHRHREVGSVSFREIAFFGVVDKRSPFF